MEIVSGVKVVGRFINLVDSLLLMDANSEDITLCVVTGDGKYLNFTHEAFKSILENIIVDDLKSNIGIKGEVKQTLRLFRGLGFIITAPGKFTNTQRINGKVRKVITVNNELYKTLKELDW